MNYLKHYEKLISSKKLIGRKKGGTEYFEKHHIIPKWLGGNNPSKRNDSRAAISRALSGKKKSDSHIEIMRINTLNAPKKTCEFCGKHIDIRNYSRWHGDNCKNKNN